MPRKSKALMEATANSSVDTSGEVSTGAPAKKLSAAKAVPNDTKALKKELAELERTHKTRTKEHDASMAAMAKAMRKDIGDIAAPVKELEAVANKLRKDLEKAETAAIKAMEKAKKTATSLEAGFARSADKTIATFVKSQGVLATRIAGLISRIGDGVK